MFTRFDEISSLPVQDIKENPKCRGRTNRRKDGRTDNVISLYTHTHSLRGYNNIGVTHAFHALTFAGY